jgi:methylated-DNA-[protein]-cysteine S-methyltransferase
VARLRRSLPLAFTALTKRRYRFLFFPKTMNAKIYFTEFSSPVGLIQLRGTDRALSGVYMEKHRHEPLRPLDAIRDAAPLGEAQRELEEYFAGERREFSVPLDSPGTAFQMRVWAGLRVIPYGETISYRELAHRIGQPKAVRAVGLANGRNPISIIVPCHRVIGANGTLTGYGGGLERKRFLLALERGESSEELPLV